jgi:hypothetical protein
MDFIEKLPMSNGCTVMLVIVDRLGHGVIIEPCDKIDAETVARKFIKIFFAYHGLPSAIVSDRGTQFVSAFWKRLCHLLKIKRRLSTAYHPETDGSTERMNQNVEAYIRMFANYVQDNWAPLCPAAMIAINGRPAASTGISPFYLDHGYDFEPLDLQEEPRRGGENSRSAVQRAEAIVAKLKDALDIAHASMAVAQQAQEDAANRFRDPAIHYKVGDKVWLDLRNIKTDRPCKKFDARNAQFTVLERIGSHAYRLNTPSRIHNVFHVNLLRPASSDPFPSQTQTDWQPPAIAIDGHDEWDVEEILNERQAHRGRGRQHQFLVKWRGYQKPTWEPASALEETEALDRWEARGQARPSPRG